MLAVAMLGNERNVVAICTYCDNLPLIATDVVVAIDRNPCSGGRNDASGNLLCRHCYGGGADAPPPYICIASNMFGRL
jgi:hypothetical protein